jgi:hypothetical protein
MFYNHNDIQRDILDKPVEMFVKPEIFEKRKKENQEEV